MGLSDFASKLTDERGKYPGPGQYPLKSCFDVPSARAPTIHGRTDGFKSTRGTTNREADVVVGPGKYDIPGLIGSGGPKITFSAPHPPAQRPSEAAALGPKYSPKQFDMATNPASPRFSFGQRHHHESRPANVPGPAAYTLKSTLNTNGPLVAFRTRPTDGALPQAADVPGPGQYAVDRFGDKLPAPRTIQPHRSLPFREDAAEKRAAAIPGPGAYDVTHGDVMDRVRPRVGAKAHAIGTLGARSHMPDPTPCGLPGPAAYGLPDSWSDSAQSKGVSILQRFPEYHDMDEIYPKPGPGDYSIPSSFDTTKGISFGFKPLEGAKRKYVVPGPGAYDPPQLSMAALVQLSPRGPKFNADKGFADGVKKSESKKEPEVEPLELNPKLVVPRPPGPKMCQPTKHAVRHVEPPPGPGAYDVLKYPATSRGTTFFRGA